MKLELKEKGGGVYVLPESLKGFTVISIRKRNHLASVKGPSYYTDPVCRVDLRPEDRDYTKRRAEFVQPDLQICRRCVDLVLSPNGPSEG